jgi:hypothetical protein
VDDEVVEIAGVAASAARYLAPGHMPDPARPQIELMLIKDRIMRSGYREQLVTGTVLTGGAACWTACHWQRVPQMPAGEHRGIPAWRTS